MFSNLFFIDQQKLLFLNRLYNYVKTDVNLSRYSIAITEL